jgi:signal peptidase I
MENRVKRGVLSALFISVLAPFLGLIYVHQPVRALICSLLVLALLLAETALGFCSEFTGMAAGIGFLGLLWLYSILLSMWLAFRGLSPETARQDLGPWIAGWLLVVLLCGSLSPMPYRLHAVASAHPVSPLQQGDYVVALRMRPADAANPKHAIRFGDRVMVRDDSGDENREYIRRVYGLPGDVLEIRGNELFRNGEGLGRGGYLPLPEDAAAWVVPQKSVFLLADEEADTAMTGFYPEKTVVDKMLYVLWSQDRSRMGIRAN